MSGNIIIPATLTLNLIICGFFSTTMAVNTYLSGLPIIDGWDATWPIALPTCAALFALLALYKIRWSIFLAFFLAGGLYAVMAYGLLDWYFDPNEQGRNGGLIPIILICLGVFILNLTGLFCHMRIRRNSLS